MVYNKKWMQFLFYLVIVSMPCISCFFFYIAFENYFKFGISNAGIIAMIGLGFSYLSYLCFSLEKFIGAKVDFNDEEFKVTFRSSVATYKWNDIARAMGTLHGQYLRLLDSSGNTIYIVDYMSPGYSKFAEKVNNAVDI